MKSHVELHLGSNVSSDAAHNANIHLSPSTAMHILLISFTGRDFTHHPPGLFTTSLTA